jgi:hypothetical protein
MIVLLCATHWTPSFENCRRSLHVHDYSYKIVGWGEKWQGWSWRSRKYLEGLPQSGTVMLLDAFDTVVAQPPDILLKAYDSFNKDIVVGAEWYCMGASNCGKVDDWWGQSKRPLRQYANAGVIVGKVEAVRTMLETMLESWVDDDQTFLAKYMSKYPKTFGLDFGSAIVQNVHYMDNLDESCIYHFPGPMLKKGLFPQYNDLVTRLLGHYGRKIYPSETYEFFSFLLQSVAVCLLL